MLDSIPCRIRTVVFTGVLAAALVGCRDNTDLSRAIAGPGHRRVTPRRVAPDSVVWRVLDEASGGNDSLVSAPISMCWRGDSLVVADATRQRLFLFDAHGRFGRELTLQPTTSARFVQLALVRCAQPGSTTAFLVVDSGLDQVLLLDNAGNVKLKAKAPHAPQLETIGDFAIGDGGRWFDSWLGSPLSIGPYLSDQDWNTNRLIRSWRVDGSAGLSFGSTVSYENTVARRVFNRVYMTIHRDTLWLLRQGDAAIVAFDAAGAVAANPLYLPVYHRGKEPTISVKAPIAAGEAFRSNRMVYDPNVAGIAVVDDSLFAIIRYGNWHWRHVGSGIGSIGRWTESSIEIVNRSGTVLNALAIQNLATDIVSNGGKNVAVLTRDPVGRRKTLFLTLR